MKALPVFVFVACLALAGCTIPCEIYFRNLTTDNVRLRATLINRQYFKKLPNQVNFYETTENKKEIIGKWKYESLVTWVDATTFFIDVPPKMAIDVADISNGLVLGTKSPDVLLLALRPNSIDTLTTGDYMSVANKFKSEHRFLANPLYYYDLK